MTYLQHFPAGAAPRGASGAWLAARLSSLWRRIRDIVDRMADHYVASAMYEALSRLSDEELHRRGLSRVDLARDVRAVCRRDRCQDQVLDQDQARAL